MKSFRHFFCTKRTPSDDGFAQAEECATGKDAKASRQSQRTGCGKSVLRMENNLKKGLRDTMAKAQISKSDLAARLDGTAKRYLIGKLEVAANGKAAGQARNLHAKRLDQTSQIRSRGFALDIGVRGQNDLVD